MKITVEKKYLVFPVNTKAVAKRMLFSVDGKTVYELQAKLDAFAPDFHANFDVSRFIGMELDLDIIPEMEISFTQSDSIDLPGLYSEELRPQVHFSPKCGWMNDPNGLIYLDGVYHMFFQYNPAEPAWDNMHWGHAVSRDLLHWEEGDIALFPDERGMMFSGSAVLDKEGVLGKGKDTAVLFYTSTIPFCQNASYSTDGLETVKHFEGNPVVPNIVGQNRDPKVIFCEELDAFVMALYLIDNVYAILSSRDLASWEEIQRFPLEGDCECPDFFPLTADDGTRKWVFIGAHDKYLVGQIRDGRFTWDQEVLTLHHGTSAYAAQTFSNLPEGRIVRMAWDRWFIPAPRVCGQMGIPTELSLTKVGEKYYLASNVIDEIEELVYEENVYENVELRPGKEFNERITDSPKLIRLRGNAPLSGTAFLSVFGRGFRFDFERNVFGFGNDLAPIYIGEAVLDLTVVIDRCSIEIFADGGRSLMSRLNPDSVADRNLPYISFRTDCDVTLEKLSISSLSSIWEK